MNKHAMKYYSEINRNELQIQWMNLKNTEQKNPDIDEYKLYDSIFILNSRGKTILMYDFRKHMKQQSRNPFFFPTSAHVRGPQWERDKFYFLSFLLFLPPLVLRSSL